MGSTQERVNQIVQHSRWNGAELASRLRVVRQNFPEAMIADQILELDVRDNDPEKTAELIVTLTNNGMAVERVSMQVNTITHLRIWSLEEESACLKQRRFVINQLAGEFAFVDGWRWISDDVRDLFFSLPRRLADECTWVTGARYGIEDGGPHGVWNRGTFVVKFAAPDSTEVVDIGIYIRNGNTVQKLAPGRSFEEVAEAPVALL